MEFQSICRSNRFALRSVRSYNSAWVKSWLLAVTVGLFSTNIGCAQWQTSEKGTIVGAAAGGALGSAIGKKSGNPITGAVLGAISGGIVGNAIGESAEQRRAADNYRLQQQQYQQQQAFRNSGVSIDEVISLTRSGLNEEIIVSHINGNGFNRTLSVNDLVLLKNNGVSDRVIMAMQRPSQNVIPAAPTVIQSRPITVVEEVHVVPSWYGQPAYYPLPIPYYGGYGGYGHPHHHRSHQRSSGMNLNFRF